VAKLKKKISLFQHAKNGITHTHSCERFALMSDAHSLGLDAIGRVCVRASKVTVFGEVYEARFPFLTTVTRPLGSVAILKFFLFILLVRAWAHNGLETLLKNIKPSPFALCKPN